MNQRGSQTGRGGEEGWRVNAGAGVWRGGAEMTLVVQPEYFPVK